MAKVILFATEAVKAEFPGVTWHARKWTTRDSGPFPKADVYWAIAVSVPDINAFVKDDNNVWQVNGDEAVAYMDPAFLAAWQAENRGTGSVGSTPKISWGTKVSNPYFRWNDVLAHAAPRPASYKPASNASNNAEKNEYLFHVRQLRAARAACLSAKQAGRVANGLPANGAESHINKSGKVSKAVQKAAKAEIAADAAMMAALNTEAQRFRTALKMIFDVYGIKPVYPSLAIPGDEVQYIPRAIPAHVVMSESGANPVSGVVPPYRQDVKN